MFTRRAKFAVAAALCAAAGVAPATVVLGHDEPATARPGASQQAQSKHLPPPQRSDGTRILDR